MLAFSLLGTSLPDALDPARRGRSRRGASGGQPPLALAPEVVGPDAAGTVIQRDDGGNV